MARRRRRCSDRKSSCCQGSRRAPIVPRSPPVASRRRNAGVAVTHPAPAIRAAVHREWAAVVPVVVVAAWAEERIAAREASAAPHRPSGSAVVAGRRTALPRWEVVAPAEPNRCSATADPASPSHDPWAAIVRRSWGLLLAQSNHRPAGAARAGHQRFGRLDANARRRSHTAQEFGRGRTRPGRFRPLAAAAAGPAVLRARR